MTPINPFRLEIPPMIAQTYCGACWSEWWGVLQCTPADGPCPSCLRAHVAKLEAREKELENLLIAQDKDALVWQARVRELEAQAQTEGST